MSTVCFNLEHFGTLVFNSKRKLDQSTDSISSECLQNSLFSTKWGWQVIVDVTVESWVSAGVVLWGSNYVQLTFS